MLVEEEQKLAAEQRMTAAREALAISTICVEILWHVGGNRDRAAFRVAATAVERGGELVVQSIPTHAARPTFRRMLFWTPWAHHITIPPPPPSHGQDAWDRWVVLWHETPGRHQGAGGAWAGRRAGQHHAARLQQCFHSPPPVRRRSRLRGSPRVVGRGPEARQSLAIPLPLLRWLHRRYFRHAFVHTTDH